MIKRLSEKYQQWNYLRKSKKTQRYSFEGIDIKILPGVFSPAGTRTTELFAAYLLKFEWKDRKVLELGAGSGLISFLLSKKGAEITASDISNNAVEGIIQNSKVLNLPVRAVYSDFFENINEAFDIIIVNPPFFQRKPDNTAERAWYCGENLEYFEALFEQFSKRNFKERIWMILSDRAPINEILKIANERSLNFQKKVELTAYKEGHIVYELMLNAIGK